MSKGFDSSIPSGTDFLQTAGYKTPKPEEPKKESLDPFEVFGKKTKLKDLDVEDLLEGSVEISEDKVRALGVDVDSILEKVKSEQPLLSNDHKVKGAGEHFRDVSYKEEEVRQNLNRIDRKESTLELHDINPFPYVFKAKYDFKFEENRAKIEDLINKSKSIIDEHELRTPELGGGTTSVVMLGTGTKGEDGKIKPFEPPHAWKEWEHFTTVWLPEQLERVWSEWRLEPAKKYISESWINEHPPGAWTEEHDHHNVTVAMGCYLDVPRDGGRLMLKNPMQSYKYAEPIHHTYWDKSPTTGEDMSWAYIPVETNDVVFFPGWLRHKTEVNNNRKESRYIMSLNVRYEFPMRGSIAGMQNLPGAEDIAHSPVPSDTMSLDEALSANEIKPRKSTREEYDRSIMN